MGYPHHPDDPEPLPNPLPGEEIRIIVELRTQSRLSQTTPRTADVLRGGADYIVILADRIAAKDAEIERLQEELKESRQAFESLEGDYAGG